MGDQGQRPGRGSERIWITVMLGAVFIMTLLSALGRQAGAPTRSGPPSVPQLTPDMIPLATGDEPVEQIFLQAGCPVCHTIPGIKGAQGRVGPKLVLATTGPRRLADPGYRGRAKTVREYVVESILDPGAYVLPGYPPRAMPRWYGQKLSALALDKITAYLEQLKEEGTD